MSDGRISRFGFAVGAAALALFVAGAADAQQFIYGNSASSIPGAMYKIDKNTGVVAATCPQSKGNGRGIVVVGNVVYFTVANSGNIFKTNFNNCSDDGIAFAVPGATSLSTIAFDGTNFWVGDYAGSDHAFYVSPTGTLLNTIDLTQCTGNCDGLEFFQGKLISNRGDASSSGYDVYSTSGGAPTTAQFIAPTGFGATGIAFDGTYFYVSNIFQQKLEVYSGTTGAHLNTVTITGMQAGNNVLEDLSADYSIVIPPGPVALTTVPTLSEWAMIVMASLLALSALYFLRGRSR